MSEMKTLKFPGDKEPREIVDAKAREDINFISEKIGNLENLETYDKSNLVTAINEAARTGGGGGLNATASALLVTILRNALYTADQSANITALEAALASGGGTDAPDTPVEPGVTYYNIVNVLTNVTNSNSASSVSEGESYTATLTAADGYNLDTVTVTMGGVDVTADVYSGGVVSIGSVTGAVIITASAVSVVASDILYALPEPTVFDGTNTIDTEIALFTTDSDWTICCRSETNAANSGSIIQAPYSVGVEKNNQFYVRNNVSNVTKIRWGVGTEIAMSSKVWTGQKAGNVFNFVVTHRANTDTVEWKSYAKNVEGVEENMNGTCNGINTTNPNNLMLGYNGVTVNDCVIYNRVLSADEITAYLGA